MNGTNGLKNGKACEVRMSASGKPYVHIPSHGPNGMNVCQTNAKNLLSHISKPPAAPRKPDLKKPEPRCHGGPRAPSDRPPPAPATRARTSAHAAPTHGMGGTARPSPGGSGRSVISRPCHRHRPAPSTTFGRYTRLGTLKEEEHQGLTGRS